MFGRGLRGRSYEFVPLVQQPLYLLVVFDHEILTRFRVPKRRLASRVANAAIAAEALLRQVSARPEGVEPPTYRFEAQFDYAGRL